MGVGYTMPFVGKPLTVAFTIFTWPYLYNDTKCTVKAGGQLPDWFPVNVGMRQACMSPNSFNIFLENVMNDITSMDKKFKLCEHMPFNIRNADDTTLISTTFEKRKTSTLELDNACKKWGLKINPSKCATISPEKKDITIDNCPIKNVDEFKFLGSIVLNCASDVTRRVSIASQAFGCLRSSILTSREMSRSKKVCLYKMLILPIAIYSSETWALREQDTRALLVFEMKCLRASLGVTCLDRLSNACIRQMLGIRQTIKDTVSERRLRWFGNVGRNSEMINATYEQDFPKGRKR